MSASEEHGLVRRGEESTTGIGSTTGDRITSHMEQAFLLQRQLDGGHRIVQEMGVAIVTVFHYDTAEHAAIPAQIEGEALVPGTQVLEPGEQGVHTGSMDKDHSHPGM